MNTGNRPFCNARTMGKQAGDARAENRRKWEAYGLAHFGMPFIIDTRDDTVQAPFMGIAGTIDAGFGFATTNDPKEAP